MATEIQKLRVICQKWGGDLVELTTRKYRELVVDSEQAHYDIRFYPAPFTKQPVALDWPCRRIVYAKGFPADKWPVFVHEMGHLFATTETPDDSNEFLFFGWEWCLAKMAGDPQVWIDANKDYGITYPGGISGDFGDLTSAKQQQVLHRQVLLGKKAGIIDAQGHPKCMPRRFNIEEIKLNLLRYLSTVQERADVLKRRGIDNGADFQMMVEKQGAVSGYKEAMADIVDILYSATTSDPKDLITRKKNNAVKS